MPLRRWLARLTNFLHPARADEEMEREMRSHLALLEDAFMRQGMPEAEARNAARRAFGGVDRAKELHREERSFAGIEIALRDLRYSVRGLARSPGFAVTVVLTLALGLGATTAIFSIVDAALLRPLGYRDPDQLYVARSVPPPRANLKNDLPVNARHFHEWRTRCGTCDQVSLIQFQDLTLVAGGDPVKLPALSVSWNFLATLGVQPVLGRNFVKNEEAPGSWDKVILTDELWRSRFSADPAIIGRTIQLNGEPHTVVGVTPHGFHLPRGDQWGAFFGPAAAPLIFRPLNFDASRMGPVGSLNYTPVIRLKPGVTGEQASVELNALLAEIVRENKLEGKIVLIPLARQITRNARGALWLLMAAVAAVLLIACANVGNLMLVRTMGRYREAAVRLALGASMTRLLSLVFYEALILVSVGGAAGIAIAWLALRVFVLSAPMDLPRLEEVGLDWRVLVFSSGSVALSALGCGILPAAWLARHAAASPSAASPRSSDNRQKLRVRETIIAVEVALGTVLLTAGALLTLSYDRVVRAERGFETARVTTQDVSFLNPKYARGGRRRFVEAVLPELARIPGVRTVGAIDHLPLRGESWVSGLRDPDRPSVRDDGTAVANFRFVSPGYWQAMGVPLKRGRLLDDSDQGRPMAVISERAATFLWPGTDPLGKHVRGAGFQGPSLEVVGVVGDVRASIEDVPPMTVYEHYWRMQPVGMSFVLRAESDVRLLAAPVRQVLAKVDSEMAIPAPQTMGHILDTVVATRRFETWLLGAFAVAGLLLAGLGIYGVVSYAVEKRTQEIGVRVALGAPSGGLVVLLVREGMIPVWIGLVVGIGCAMATGKLIQTQLYGVAAGDPAVIASITAALLVFGAGACWIPARRITRIDPVAALRSE